MKFVKIFALLAALILTFAACGKVTEGMEIVDAICEAANPIDRNGLVARSEQPVIKTVTIREG